MADGEESVTNMPEAQATLAASETGIETASILSRQVDEFLNRMMKDYEALGVNPPSLMAIRLAQYRVEVAREWMEKAVKELYEAHALLDVL